MTPAVRVRRIAAGEAALLREVRLRALQDTPLAFGSTHDREAAWPPAHWEEWAQEAARPGGDQAVLLAESIPPAAETGPPAGAPAGLAWGVVDRDDPALALLFSMWVAPEARGSGAGGALVAAVVAWARERGARTLRTSVTVGNDAAARLYARAGFADTGRREPLGHSGAEVVVLELAL